MKSFVSYLEELKGKQHKLDVNKDGKITKDDFNILNKNNIKKEYVDDKGKLVEKPKVDLKADYDGPDPKSPQDQKSPYKAANDNTKSPTVDVEKNGLGDMGDKNLKYEPDTEYKQTVVKTKTENFLNKTKNMSLSEFTKYMLDECGCGNVSDDSLPFVTAYTTGKFQPHPPEAIKYVVVLANKNDNVLDSMVHEMKSSGLLGKVIKALLNHPEAYDELTSLFGDQQEGPNRCKLFAKSMNNSVSDFIKSHKSLYEAVSKPFGFKDDEMEMSDDDDMEMGDDDMEMGDDDMGDDDMEMGDDDMGDDDMEMGDDDDDMEMGDDDDDMEMGDDDDDMEMGDDDDDMDMGDDMGDDMSDEDMGDDIEMRKKLKRKFAHNNLIDAIKNYKLD